MEDRRAEAKENPADEKYGEVRGVGQRQQSGQGRRHADRERVRKGMALGIVTNERLKRGGDLVDEGQ